MYFQVSTTEFLRLDRYLSAMVPDMSRSRIQKLIEQEYVTLNQQICTEKKTLLKIGDSIEITIPPTHPLDLIPQPIPLDILYEDDHLLVINKSVGLVVHPSPGHADTTLVNAILSHCSHLSGINGIERPGIVHRLDKDTSGAIVVAKTDRAHQHLQGQIQSKSARREYLGVVHGSPPQSQGTIDAPIGRHPVDRKKMAVISHGRSAVTHWHVEERLGMYSLLLFRLETGRTHQIRVHTTHTGHPIVGDRLYSHLSTKVGRWIPHQALHAWKLGFIHPETGKPIEVQATPPETFTRLLQRLRHRGITL